MLLIPNPRNKEAKYFSGKKLAKPVALPYTVAVQIPVSISIPKHRGKAIFDGRIYGIVGKSIMMIA